MDSSPQDLLSQLNQETGKLGWIEVERHFARGVVVKVAAELDLVEVAAAMARDDQASFSQWLDAGQIARAESEDAIRWHEGQAIFWAVVVAPWVLVQEIGREQ